ncbi:MAG: hypothetical protein LBG10_09945 [Treponema sp.]|nr:hypothetical protein [Treponema sp.]
MRSPFLWCGVFLFGFLFYLSAEDGPSPDTVHEPGVGEPGTPAMELNVDDLRRRIEHEAGSELVSLQLGDSEVSLQVSGYWKSSLSGNWGISLTPLGTAATSPDSPVLFKQEADLTLSLWIRERWFVEASFLDDHNLNTYRAGYQGFPGEAVQYVGVGNTGLDFPNFPYLDLGGDSPSSLGLYGRFGGGPVSLHTLFRYDLAALEERIFVGNRERTFTYTPLNRPVRGRSFVLPDEHLDAPPQVYLEDEKGDLRDQRGRRWRLAAASEYGAGAASGLVELGVSPKKSVAAAYSRGGNNRPWDSSLGTYGNPAASQPVSGGGFLGDVQDWFGDETILQNYPMPSGDGSVPGSPGTVTLNNGATALVVYEPGTFSPFERMSRYEASSSNSSSAALVRLSTGDRFPGYEAVPLDDSAVSPNIPLYSATETQRGIYELLGNDFSRERRSRETRWPLGNSYPQIYLPGSGHFTGDLGIRFTNYSGAGSYSIGTDVVPGSVQVWRSGLADTRIAYNAGSGAVTLENPAGFNEVIRITYLKRSEERKAGSLAAGVGAIYNEGGPFSSELALGVRWNIAGDSYAENGALNPGTVGMGAKTAWDYDRLKARITMGLGFEQPDTTGLYRAAGMEGNEITLGLSPESSFISEAPGNSASASSLFSGLTRNNRSDLVYRNYRDTGILGNSTLMSIGWGGASVISGQNGPYPVRDSGLTSQTHVLAAEFALDDEKKWTGFEVPLGNDGTIMEAIQEIEVPFRFYDFAGTPPPDFTLILQIGVLSDKDLGFIENPGRIVEKQLYPPSSDPNINNYNNPALFDMNARIAGIRITSEERRKLQGATYLRLIAVHTGPEEIRGRVLLAPPIVRGAGFRPIRVDGFVITGSSGNEVRAVEGMETGSNRLESAYGSLLDRLHSENKTQRVLEVSWDDMDAGISAGADGRLNAVPLGSYRKLSFFVKGPSPEGSGPFTGGTLRFILAQGPESLAREEEISLDAEIPLAAFQPGEWSKVEINYQGQDKGVRVRGGSVKGAKLKYRSPAETRTGDTGEEKSGYAAIFVSPGGGSSLAAGSFYFDELILEDPAPAYWLNGGTGAEWKQPGTLVSYRGEPVLSDLSLATALESGIRGDPFTPDSEHSGAVISRSNGEITLLGARLRTNVSFTVSDNDFYWNGGHGVSRSWGPFSVEESFSAAPGDKTMDHRLGLGLSGIFSSRLNGEVYYEDEKLDRKWDGSLGFSPPWDYIPAVSVETSAAWTENTPDPAGWMEHYGEIWARSWGPMVPDLGAGAAKRDTRSVIRITGRTSPVGAEVTLEGSSAFSNPNNRTQSANLVRLDIPVTFGFYRFGLRGERTFKRHLLFSPPDALGDGAKFAESIADSLPLWKVFPLYSLFAPELGNAMDEGLSNYPSADLAEYTYFDDRFGLTVQLPQVYDLRAFFIPSSAGARIDRILEQKLDTRLDMLNLTGSLGFSAVNMFGAFGVVPLLPFYQGDEFTHALETSVAIPRNEDLSWRVQSHQAAAFYGFYGGTLGFTNTVTSGSSGWVESFILDWTVPTRKSLLSVFYGWIAAAAQTQSSWLALSDLLNTNYEQLRRETLELAFDHSGDYLQWSLIAGHESIIRILGRLNFSVFAKLNCTQDERVQVLSFIGTIGTTLNVSF